MRFEVTDTGSGIAAEEMTRLFQPFTQSATGRKAVEGAGLGLVITRQFAELLGGGIEARSVVGEGSTFTIVVQAVEGAERVAEAEGALPARRGRGSSRIGGTATGRERPGRGAAGLAR
ncbi:MAG: hypothetical protein JNK95_03565 [Candidatus Competibacter sp.]|nr:hypothetical protein [Candidatus Competibacter sp.]MDG4606044.1 ATP-binding protein [Candidatus Contendobacter sp.]HRD50929.1 ATP-binding protein [Candidatus Contendobacter sp.]